MSRPRPDARRAGLRAAVLALPLLLVLAVPAVASAAVTDDLPGRSAPFSVVDGILIFGVVPVGVFLLVALVVLRPGTAPRAQRYRPGRDWQAAPSWSGLQPAVPPGEGAPARPAGEPEMPVMDAAALVNAEPGSEVATAGDGEHRPAAPDTDPSPGGGGARGSW